MNGAKIGEFPWGCLAVFSIIGLLVFLYLIFKGCLWFYNHINIVS
jgi:hypothetical protein